MRNKARTRGAQPGFSVERARRADGVDVIALVGDSERCEDARPLVAAAVAAALEADGRRILIDATRLDWMTIDVAGALVGDFPRLRDAGGWILFAGLDDQVGPLLEEVGVLDFIGHTETVEEGAAWLLEHVGETGPLAPQRLETGEEEGPGGVRILSLRGALDEADGLQLATRVQGLVAAGARGVVVDAAELLDAEGLGALVLLAEQARAGGARLAVASLQGIPRAVVEVLGLDALLELHEDLDAALASLAG
ncbi:MAG: STAS domain-containing protein [Planctomycetota bacterium]